MTAWQKALGGRAANIVSTISPEDCKDYCQGYKVKSERKERKEGSQATDPLSLTNHPGYEEYGTHTTLGQRTDLTKAITAIQNGATIRDLIEEMPGTTNGAYRMLTEYKQQTLHLTARQQVLDMYKDVQWKPFQQKIIDHLETEPDGRTLNWYHEPDGNIGKSYLTKYLMASDQAYCPDITKPADIFCGYNLQPIVIFDIPRSRIDTMDHIYGVIEKFLNGMIFVGKYNSHQLCIKPPHVIVFSNDEPKKYTEKGNLTLSEDRWNIIKIPPNVNDKLMTKAKIDSHKPPASPTSPKKRKEPDFAKTIMSQKDREPNATKQQRLETLEGLENPTVFNKNDY